VDRCDLHIFDRPSAIAFLVLDAHIRRLDVVIHDGQLVRLCPLLDLVLVTIGAPVTVAATAILGLEETLVLALEFVVEDHAMHSRVARVEPFRSTQIGSVELRVVSQFAWLRDARIELLTFPINPSPCTLENLTTTVRQRHDGRARVANDVWRGAHEPELTQVCEVASTSVCGPTVVVAKIGRRDDAERPDRRQRTSF
jgi:hypothetical protein